MPARKGVKSVKAKSDTAPKTAKATTRKAGRKPQKPAPTAQASEAEPTEIKTRKSRKNGIASYAELLKKQAEFESIKKKAKGELRKQYDAKIAEADEIKKRYSDLFGEPIDSAPRKEKGKKTAAPARKTRPRGFSLEQIESFIEQKDSGIDLGKIKIAGKNITGVKKIDAAYEKAEDKDAKAILELLK